VARPDLVLEVGVTVGATVTAKRILMGAVGLALLVVVVAVVVILARGDDNFDDASTSSDESADTTADGDTGLPVVADDTWCEGWRNLVALQAQWVAAPTDESAALLLSAVDTLQELGAPESLDPSGYTEMTAVLDDVRASVDPSFTASVAPSEPADVGLGHEHGDEGEAEDEHVEAPFGTWLADHCSV
jgi:hypothetical protein